MRRRLRAIKNCLAITLGRLAKVCAVVDGSCVFSSGFLGEIPFWILMDAIIIIIIIIIFMGFSTLSFCVALIHGCSWDKSMDMVGIYCGRDEIKRNSGTNKLTGIIG